MKAPQTVLVVHGAGKPRRRSGKVYWEPLLEQALGPGYVVQAPLMPTPTDPKYPAWAQRIRELTATLVSPVLVGHSFGASVLLKYLCEASPAAAVSGLFLVATPFWGSTLPELVLPPDFAARLSGVSPMFFYHSKDDAEVPLAHVERYRRALPHAVVRILDGRGHEFAEREFPELAADIRGLR